MADGNGGLKAAARAVIGQWPVRGALFRLAAARGRALILCYHRVSPETGSDRVIDPVAPERFVEHIRALRSVGDIVPVKQLLSSPHGQRPRFAVTFDDDHPSHVQFALRLLRSLRVPAAFFLSGRALCGFGAYWWDLLERSVEEVGLDATCQLLGQSAGSVKELARRCRGAVMVKELPTRRAPAVMAPGDVRTLADAGMTIGFHTLRHPVLPLLNDAELSRELTQGRDALSAAAGVQIDLLAYPFGHADPRVAHAARQAGYTAAFALGERAIGRHSDPFLLGRWQPGADDAATVLTEAALRLTRGVGPRAL